MPAWRRTLIVLWKTGAGCGPTSSCSWLAERRQTAVHRWAPPNLGRRPTPRLFLMDASSTGPHRQASSCIHFFSSENNSSLLRGSSINCASCKLSHGGTMTLSRPRGSDAIRSRRDWLRPLTVHPTADPYCFHPPCLVAAGKPWGVALQSAREGFKGLRWIA